MKYNLVIVIGGNNSYIEQINLDGETSVIFTGSKVNVKIKYKELQNDY